MNSWSLLPWCLKPDEVASGDNRTVIQVAGRDPYAWKGYTTADKDVHLRQFNQAWDTGKGATADKA